MKSLKNQNSFIFILLIINILFPQSMESSERAILLKPIDIAYEYLQRKQGRALGSALNDPNYWESYNQWMCFESSVIELARVEVVYSGTHKWMPAINVRLLGHLFNISLSAETEYDFDAIYNRWKELLANTKQVCAYAAHLPSNYPGEDPATSIWVITRLKTELGYWNEFEEPGV